MEVSKLRVFSMEVSKLIEFLQKYKSHAIYLNNKGALDSIDLEKFKIEIYDDTEVLILSTDQDKPLLPSFVTGKKL